MFFLRNFAKVIRPIMFFFSGFFKKDPKMIVLGAWWGDKLADNSFYYLKDLLTKDYSKTYKFVWIGKSNLKKQVESSFSGRVKFCKINSLKSLVFIAKAKYGFVSNGTADLGRFVPNKDMIIIQLWHGFPFKRIGADMRGASNEGNKAFEFYSFYLSTSEVMTTRLLSAFRNYGIDRKKIIETGQPRNLALYENSELRKKLNIADNKRIVTYLPTFRDNSDKTFEFANMDKNLLLMLEKNNIVVLEKPHHHKYKKMANEQNTSVIIHVDDKVDTQKLLKITDILITDFSSVYADYLYLDRPIVHFLFDGLDYLNNDRGLYEQNFDEEFAGPIVFNIEKVIQLIINKNELEKYSYKRETLKNRINQYSVKDSTNIISKKVGIDNG
ncbi:CDP-glycerol glycerophosphotransferase family protein [Pediococcus parvulus]|uniref:CDP-glycerol glycerophosphotransferase family protein n=1 Tax=Pediococcus parvulus TaxID=54062 RepID=UPI00345EDC22